MQEIKGEKFYVSLGYIENLDELNVANIKSLIMDTKDGTVYLDNSDRDNIVMLPIMKVNDIQKYEDTYKFKILVYTNKTKWIDNENKQMCKFNIIGLFGVRKEDNQEIIRHIQFYKTYTEYLNTNSKVVNLLIEANKEKIIGE